MKKIAVIQFRREKQTLDHEIENILDKTNLKRENLVVFNGLIDKLPSVNIDNYDGFIFGGSGNVSVSKDLEDAEFIRKNIAQLMKDIVENDKPSLFICLGLHFLSDMFGVDVVSIPEHSYVGTLDITLTEEAAQDPLFADLPMTFAVQEGHSDSVCEIPEDAVLLAKSHCSPVEAFRIKDNIYAVQFHPEHNKEDFEKRMGFYPHYVKGKEDSLKINESPHAWKIMQNFVSLI